MANVLVITEHMKGEFQDISFEMLGQARKLAAGGSCSAIVYGSMKDRASELGAADRVLSPCGRAALRAGARGRQCVECAL